MTITLYGIKNCDTVKKARKWLEQHAIDYRFVDHRADGLDPVELARWLAVLGWEQLVNKRGTTYRALSDADKASLGPDTAAARLLSSPAMIKRPLLELDGQLHLGFNAELYSRLFNK
ncbi:ArsC family reductase [Zobellella endophytica]|uniref:ArsC family reductase n=1 Tax=Zobellella endophytica TaxID=2116700 RepID=A0A2P7R6D2_9GAMM|nr:ArsC family reductase [Zobellella endophytica]PSJ45752.1 ArsC family reductase [Zobellella endophytica]